MTPQEIKNHIIVTEKIEYLLEELECHHIKSHDNNRYITCGMPDGDNTKSTTIFTDNLKVIANTRDIEDEYGNSDIISLVIFVKKLYFSQALKWICDIVGLDYYNENDIEIPKSLQILNMINDMNKNVNLEEDVALKPINENILETYFPYWNRLFLNDGIDIFTQAEFEIGIDLDSRRITIPIRDEIGTLVGVKGRLINKDSSGDDKYIYLERCSKTKILYGLFKSMQYAKELDEIIIVESEKNMIYLWSKGIKNVVAIGGHSLSKTQVEKVIRIGIKSVVLCYDQDVARLENGKLDKEYYNKEASKFINGISVYAMVDVNNTILKEKESPSDAIETYLKMYEERKLIKNGSKVS